MAIQSRRITVPDTEVVLVTASSDNNVAGRSVIITNRGGGTVDLGPPGVTSGSGYGLMVGESVSMELDTGERIYAISSAAATVHVLEQGVE